DTPSMAPAIKDYLKEICKRENPDLIVLGGDNIASSCGKAATQLIAEYQVRKGINNFMSIFENLGIPVATVFGNHDGERMVSKETQMEYYSRYSVFVGYDEGEEIYGCGNYNLPILSSDGSKTAYNLWFFDSNMYDREIDGFDYVHDDQVANYVKISNELKAENGGVPVPSMAFQHIAVSEIDEAVENGEMLFGEYNEKPDCGAIKSSQFEAMLAQGDVKAMFFGHNHANTFGVRYKGIDLIETPAAGFNLSDENRGVRVITLNENDTSTYETHLINYKETFCVDEISTARYYMNAAEIGEKEQFKYAMKYLGLSITRLFGVCVEFIAMLF
ncbi:MAG: metallophosphoesterase, partial [Acutalibacteraceae bacterium]